MIKARDFRRRPENGGSWSNEAIDAFKGVPWEPYPGARGGYEIKSKVRMPILQEPITEGVRAPQEGVTRRRLRITKADLEKFGTTVGCPGCRAFTRGGAAANHNEECRNRLVRKFEEEGDARIERENERLLEYLEEARKRKRQRAGEQKEGEGQEQAAQASASSSCTTAEQVHRSTGGAPIAMDEDPGEARQGKRKSDQSQDERGAQVRVQEEEARGEKRETRPDEWDEYAARLRERREERHKNLEKVENDPPPEVVREMMGEIAEVSFSESDVTF